ncbi:HtaA domain-containing protein [Leucobacter aridicollis]|uniref:HtaA domain-containing protein n=1 Tax=Leucobacter aridicollis TaxID=283878 RepID=UPI002105FB82|nr:HtaA domain-containing protein [Leucobacter aridicollis]UTX52733.1 HtaA domain-containing protein [Leucobacter aridicollis]
MKSRAASRLSAAVSGAAVVAAMLVAPAAAQALAPSSIAQSTAAPAGTGSCEITGGTLKWGVKASFRSYISGSIANGSWEPGDGVTYETPEFTWTGGAGELDPATGVGEVSFAGSVHFTGHDGVLDLTLANPTIEFEGDGNAALMLDAKSTDMEGKVTVDTAQEWVGELVAPAAVALQGEKLEISAMQASLTNSGAAAFAGFYEAGAELDPVTLSLETTGCEATATTATEPTAEPTPAQPAEEATPVTAEARIPWLPIIVGGAALVVIALTTGMLIGGRKKKPQEGGEGSAEAQPGGDPE